MGRSGGLTDTTTEIQQMSDSRAPIAYTLAFTHDADSADDPMITSVAHMRGILALPPSLITDQIDYPKTEQFDAFDDLHADLVAKSILFDHGLSKYNAVYFIWRSDS